MITTEQISQWVEGSDVLYKKLFQSYVEREYLKSQCSEFCDIFCLLISSSDQESYSKGRFVNKYSIEDISNYLEKRIDEKWIMVISRLFTVDQDKFTEMCREDVSLPINIVLSAILAGLFLYLESSKNY